MPRIDGPDGGLAARLSIDGGDHDRPTLAVERDGRTVVRPSPLPDPLTHLDDPSPADVDRSDRSVDERFRTAAGKRRDHRHRAREATFAFPGGVELDVRVASDGVAYRARAPVGGGRLVGGGGRVSLPPSALGWLMPYADNHEAIARPLPVTAADGEFSLPGLFRVGEDWLLVAEAGVDGSFAAGRLATDDGESTLGLTHPPVYATGELETPWRTFVVGDLADVVETDLVPALVEGQRVDPDADWVRPGRVAWSWWSEPSSPADEARQREYVDYAADRGWEYVLVDDGWEPGWVPDLVEYARERGVEVFLWAHYTQLDDAAAREERLARWADWGVAGVKVDFMDSDDQGRLAFYDRLAAAAAEYELLVNFHGSVVPTGLRRRWPNVMTYEGVYGAEQYGWSTLTPGHNVTLPFTRNAVGPMDYTPVTFSADRRYTTAGHELALSVLFETGLQHLADAVEEYAARPPAEALLERVPAAWDDTRFVGGYPGDAVTLARRRGGEWFLGSAVAGAGRRVEAPCEFLDGPRTAHVVRDALDVADPDPGPGEALVAGERSVGPDDPLSVRLPEHGGFVARLPPG